MPTLWIIGTPLEESQRLSAHAIETMEKCKILIGESRNVVDRYLKNSQVKAERFFLDPFREPDWKEFVKQFSGLKGDESACLLSDVGMPILFDPGEAVLDLAREKKFAIRSVPSATSWASACAVSGFSPPFFLQGFLNREAKTRENELAALSKMDAHLVLMETPYRYRAFLKSLSEILGKDRQVFLAWNIAQESERYFWGSLKELAAFSDQHQLEKGEFILIVKRRN